MRTPFCSNASITPLTPLSEVESRFTHLQDTYLQTSLRDIRKQIRTLRHIVSEPSFLWTETSRALDLLERIERFANLPLLEIDPRIQQIVLQHLFKQPCSRQRAPNASFKLDRLRSKVNTLMLSLFHLKVEDTRSQITDLRHQLLHFDSPWNRHNQIETLLTHLNALANVRLADPDPRIQQIVQHRLLPPPPERSTCTIS